VTKLVVLLLLLLSSTVAGHELGDIIDCYFTPPHVFTDSLLTIDTVRFEETGWVCNYYGKDTNCLVTHPERWRPILCSTYVSYVVKDTVGWEKKCDRMVLYLDDGTTEETDCHWAPIVKKRVCK